MEWEDLARLETGRIRRAGRFIVAELDGPHRTLTTSARNGGQAEHVRLFVNHQSCEGSGHDARAHVMLDDGPERYHDRVCAEIAAVPAITAVMGTAANMHYVAVASERDGDVGATAVVTAGVADQRDLQPVTRRAGVKAPTASCARRRSAAPSTRCC